MSALRPHVLIADGSEDYALRLEDKFLRMMRNAIDLEVITDRTYFSKFFSSPRHLDVALISEDLIIPNLDNQTIDKLFIMSEEVNRETLDDGQVRIYKYTSLSHVFNQTMGDFSHLAKTRSSRQAPRAIVLFSPVGGSGKTTIAIGVGTCLQDAGYRVLYVDAEYLQAVGKLFSRVGKMSGNAALALARGSKNPYAIAKQCIVHDVIDVLPPLSANILMFGISFDTYTRIIEGAMQSGDYDYVIIDTDSAFNAEKLELVQMCDAVVIPTTQGAIQQEKVSMFLKGLDTSGQEKCHIVLNKSSTGSSNSHDADRSGLRIEARIKRDTAIPRFSASKLASHGDMQTVALLVR